MALAAALALLLAAGAAEAQTPTSKKLVGNTSKSVGWFSFGSGSQAFTTGSETRGYTLTAVNIFMFNTDTLHPDPMVNRSLQADYQ